MLWDKIKKAINSTIGTPNFKPLNEIVEDAFSTVTEKQNETQKSLKETQDSLRSGENEFIVAYAKSSCNVYYGSYIGNGNRSFSLDLPFNALFISISAKDITDQGGEVSTNDRAQMFAVGGQSFSAVIDSGSSNKVASLNWNGNRLTISESNYTSLNILEKQYIYCIVGLSMEV